MWTSRVWESLRGVSGRTGVTGKIGAGGWRVECRVRRFDSVTVKGLICTRHSGGLEPKTTTETVFIRRVRVREGPGKEV